MSRTIYVSMDALVAPGVQPDPFLGHGIAPYARPFLHWCANNARTVLVTDGPLPHAFRFLQQVGADNIGISVRAFDSNKTDLLHPNDDFYLVDDALIPGEASWFSEHGLGDRIVPVDPHKGVTQATKQQLEEKIHGKHKR